MAFLLALAPSTVSVVVVLKWWGLNAVIVLK